MLTPHALTTCFGMSTNKLWSNGTLGGCIIRHINALNTGSATINNSLAVQQDISSLQAYKNTQTYGFNSSLYVTNQIPSQQLNMIQTARKLMHQWVIKSQQLTQPQKPSNTSHPHGQSMLIFAAINEHW